LDRHHRSLLRRRREPARAAEGGDPGRRGAGLRGGRRLLYGRRGARQRSGGRAGAGADGHADRSHDTPLTLLIGVATVHGNNLMDTPYKIPDGLTGWLDIVTMPPGATFPQTTPGRYRAQGYDDFRHEPEVDEYTLDTPGRWTRLDGDGAVTAEGRLIGGRVEILINLAGTPYLDVTPLTGDGLVVYLEACEDDAYAICRNLHGMRLAGLFDHAAAILVGRTRAPDMRTLTQHEAVL